MRWWTRTRLWSCSIPEATWKRKTYTNFEARPLQVQVFRGGELVYQQPSLQEIQAYCAQQVDTLWDEVKRFENPHNYYGLYL